MPTLNNSGSPYEPRTWTNGKTKLNASNMNNIETGIQEAKAAAEAVSEIANEAKTLAQNLQTSKQDTLTAGENITIENNIISAVGGGGTLNFDDLALYTKYGVFRINGEAIDINNIPEYYRSDVSNEILLDNGKVHELSGYLKGGHITVKTSYDPEDPTKEVGANTQIVFNNLYVKADKPQAFYSIQSKKKVAIKLADNSSNYLYAGDYTYTPEEAEGVIQAEGNLLITSAKNSYLFVKASGDLRDVAQHAVKASRLYLSGNGSIEVESYHDGFHGGKLLRIDSGNYKVNHASVDGFEAKYLQIFGGNIEITNCYGSAISSKESKGVVAGYTAKFIFGDSITSQNRFYNMDILETVPQIEGTAPISLATYFGTAVVKEGYMEGMTDDQIAALPNVTIDEETNMYETTNTSIYVKGLVQNPIVVKTKSTDIYFDKACVNVSDFGYAIKYDNTSKKLAIRPRVDDEGDDYIDLSLIIYSGNACAIKSNKNCTIQGDNALIIKSSGKLAEASEFVLRADDGIKILDAEKNNTTYTSIFVGGDKDQAEKFNAGTVLANFVLESKYDEEKSASDDGKVKIVNGQVGHVAAKALFGKEIIENYGAEADGYSTNIILEKDTNQYLLERLYLLENA